jgi:hypothetical protein
MILKKIDAQSSAATPCCEAAPDAQFKSIKINTMYNNLKRSLVPRSHVVERRLMHNSNQCYQ